MGAPATVNATHSYNTALYYYKDTTDGYTEIGGWVNISGPKAKVTQSKASTLRSPSARVEKVPGMVDEGQASGTLRFRKANETLLRSFIRVPQNFKVQAADGTTTTSGSSWTFDGNIAELG